MPPRFDMRAFVNAWNTHQTDRIVDFYADDAEILVPPDPEPYRGKEGVRQNVQEVTRGMEDINGDVVWSAQEGDRLAALVRVSGKHTGPMPITSEQVIPATNRKVEFMIGLFLELDANGKIRRETDLADNLGLLQQVGAAPLASGQATGTTQAGARQPGLTR